MLVALGIAIAAGLAYARPWELHQQECAVIVRPGTSIQSVIDASDEGAVICLTRGVWTENIVIDRSLTLVGSGVGRTTIKADVFTRPVIEVPPDDTQMLSVTLKGLTITGDSGSGGVKAGGSASLEIMSCSMSGRQYGVWLVDSAAAAITGSSLSEHTHRGIILQDSSTSTITDCRIRDNRALGVGVSDFAEAKLVNCDIAGNGGHGFWLRGEADVALIDCSVSQNRGHGLLLEDHSAVQLLRSEVSDNLDQGVVAGDATVVTLSESEVLSHWHGIDLRDTAAATISDSTVSGGRFDGIRIQHSAEAMISGSTISANRRGVWVTGQAQATITDCLLEANLGYGVYCRSPGGVVGEGNRFIDNGVDLGGDLFGTIRLPLTDPSENVIVWPDDRFASLQEAVDALLPGGTLVLEPGIHPAGLTIGSELSIEVSGGEAILQGKSLALPVLSLVGGADLRVAGVAIRDGAEGVLIAADARAVLVGCRISGNVEAINLTYSSSVEVSDSLVVHNEHRGITVVGEAQATITGCLVSGNQGAGIAVGDTARVSVADSRITENRGEGGFVFWGLSEVALDGNTIIDNRGYGVAMFQRPCMSRSPWVFRGIVSGSNNRIRDNRLGGVCPPEVEFLVTPEGGELDLRP